MHPCATLLKNANAFGVVWSLLKTLSFASGLLAALTAFTGNAHHSESTESLVKKIEKVQRLHQTKRAKLGFLCTLKRRIKYKFPNAARYGSVAHIKALYGFGKVLKNFLAHHMQRKGRSSLGKWSFCYMNHSVPYFDTLLREQETQTA